MATSKTISFLFLCILMIIGIAVLIGKQRSLQLGARTMYIKHQTLKEEISNLIKSSRKNDNYGKASYNETINAGTRFSVITTFKPSIHKKGIIEPWVSRLRMLQEGCASNKDIHNNSHPLGKRLMFSWKNNFLYCKAPKTGCTFLTSLYAILELGESPERAFGRNRDGIHFRTVKYLSRNISNSRNVKFTKIVVARDPYRRLLSGYIDKVYLLGFPGVAVNVASRSGNKLYTIRGLQCGYVTTFNDFIEHCVGKALQTGNIDNHWKAIYDMCKVCDIDYQLVLKTETLSKDADYTINYLPIDNKIKTVVNKALHSQNLETVIESLVNTYLNYQSSTNRKCSNRIVYVYKLWEAFKILGYIKRTIPFPWEKLQNMKDLNKSFVSNFILETMRRDPLTGPEKTKQKHDALVAAYRQVKQSTIDKIKTYYKYDFLLFEYDENPPGHI